MTAIIADNRKQQYGRPNRRYLYWNYDRSSQLFGALSLNSSRSKTQIFRWNFDSISRMMDYINVRPKADE